MDSTPSTNSSQAPEAEVLKPLASDPGVDAAAAPPTPPPEPKDGKKPKHRTYRPSHKGTFMGLAVVIAILAINALVISVLLKKQNKDDLEKKGQVTISSAELSKLGIDRNSIGESGVVLTVAPNAQFKGTLSVAGNTNLSGQLLLNSKLLGTNASFTQLQAGDTSLSKLEINGDTTTSNLNLRKDLVVAGITQLQGPVTLKQLLTVDNSINVTGNLAVGGVLTVNRFSVQSLTVGGHLISGGPTPSVSRGSALGSNGTVSISGNDAAGTVAINIGVGAGGGTLASVAFRNAYSSLPHVVITPVGIGANFYISNLSLGGFTVAVASGLPPGGYQINYIVEQ